MAVLDELYAQTDKVYACEQFQIDSSGSAASVREIDVSEDDDGVTIIEMRMGWTLSFPVKSVLDAVWSITRMHATKRGRVFEDGDMMTVFFEIAKFSVASITGRVLAKEYASHSDTPTEIVSHSLASVTKKPPGASKDLDIEYADDSWVRFVDVVVSGHSMTSVQIARRIHKAFSTDDSNDSHIS